MFSLSFFFLNLLRPVTSAYVLMGMGAATEAWLTSQEPHSLKKTGSHVLYRAPAVLGSSARGWGLCVSSSCVGLLIGLIVWYREFMAVVAMVYSEDIAPVTPDLWLFHNIIPESFVEGCVTDVPCMATAHYF